MYQTHQVLLLYLKQHLTFSFASLSQWKESKGCPTQTHRHNMSGTIWCVTVLFWEESWTNRMVVFNIPEKHRGLILCSLNSALSCAVYHDILPVSNIIGSVAIPSSVSLQKCLLLSVKHWNSVVVLVLVIINNNSYHITNVIFRVCILSLMRRSCLNSGPIKGGWKRKLGWGDFQWSKVQHPGRFPEQLTGSAEVYINRSQESSRHNHLPWDSRALNNLFLYLFHTSQGQVISHK